jgi:hypothetical protein
VIPANEVRAVRVFVTAARGQADQPAAKFLVRGAGAEIVAETTFLTGAQADS